MASRREHRGRQKRPSRGRRRARREAHLRVPEPEIVLPFRRTEPETVVAHVGPTNSGKTHAALEFLAETGRGVFAAPLRMLAQEAHRRLSAQLGADHVGLVTGEERVNERAPIICCTAEMAPLSGEVLVLDEVQWADDAERGSAWTRLLLAGEYRHILLLGAVEALPLVQNAFPQAEIRFFERKAPLDWTGPVSFQSLQPGTVVVAFSRRAVLALAGELNRRQPGKVAVLYGAMPLASRRLEIERFINGQAAVCCATDVLGHGVNLPCETLLFAESQKFDGEERRDLHAWEIAQIAGRAGRFGLVERGHVGVLTGIVWANADPDLIESALHPTCRCPAATSATESSTPHESGRGWRICRSRARSSCRPHSAPGTRPRFGSGRPTAGSRSSRSGRYSCGSTPCRGGCASADDGSRSSRSGSSSTRRWTRTTPSCSARSRSPSPPIAR